MATTDISIPNETQGKTSGGERDRAPAHTLAEAKRDFGECEARPDAPLSAKHAAAEEANQADDDQVDRDNVVEQPRHNEDQDARNE